MWAGKEERRRINKSASLFCVLGLIGNSNGNTYLGIEMLILDSIHTYILPTEWSHSPGFRLLILLRIFFISPFFAYFHVFVGGNDACVCVYQYLRRALIYLASSKTMISSYAKDENDLLLQSARARQHWLPRSTYVCHVGVCIICNFSTTLSLSLFHTLSRYESRFASLRFAPAVYRLHEISLWCCVRILWSDVSRDEITAFHTLTHPCIRRKNTN